MVSQQQWDSLAVGDPAEARRAVRANRRSRLIFVSLAVGLSGLLVGMKRAVFDQPGGFNPDSDGQLTVVTIVVCLVLLFGWSTWYAGRHRQIAKAAMAEHRGFYALTFMPTGQGMTLYSTLVLAPDGVWLIPGRRLARHESTAHIPVGQIVGIRAGDERGGSRGRQLEILGASGVLVRGWVLTIFRGQLGIEKMLDKLGQPPSDPSAHDRPRLEKSGSAPVAEQEGNGLVYPVVVVPPPRNYQWIIWKIMVGGFLPLMILTLGVVQTVDFESVHRDPNAITVMATVDTVEKTCGKGGGCSWNSYGHYTVVGQDVYNVKIVSLASTPTYGNHAIRVVPGRPLIVYPVGDNGSFYMRNVILGLFGVVMSVALNLRAYLRRRKRSRQTSSLAVGA